MTKRQRQWLEVGMAFEKSSSERTMRQANIACDGLCRGIHTVTGDFNYYARIRIVLGRVGYWFGLTNRYTDYLRATFAYLMAAMTDSERDAIVEGL